MDTITTQRRAKSSSVLLRRAGFHCQCLHSSLGRTSVWSAQACPHAIPQVSSLSLSCLCLIICLQEPPNIPVSAAYGVPTWSSFGCEDYEWVSADGGGGYEMSHGFVVDDSVRGPVPSLDEVNNAVSALQK